MQKEGYIRKTDSRITKAGFEASIYELSAKAFLAFMLDSISFDDLFSLMTEEIATETMAALARIRMVDRLSARP
ncbi:MAG: hypothetical protein MUO85_05780 [candidate division Zixibacteria bacterium]|nr:hypothetical protein [candidate division Zixibacteria bacterium]